MGPLSRDGLDEAFDLAVRSGCVGSGEEMADVVPALSGADAAIMKRPVGDPMLRLRRITRCADGSALEYVESLLDPARFGLRVSF